MFISSTYLDLREERQRVMWALLQMDHIPTGMELFPASNEEVWEAIEGVISECDYYVLILGGRYGSQDEKGLSYTEREYDFARSHDIPTIAFVRNPGSITVDKADDDEASKKKLHAFRDKVKAHLVRHWDTPDELASQVILGLQALTGKRPAVGWIRADQASPDAADEISRLRGDVLRLQAQLNEAEERAAPDWSRLAHGDDTVEIIYTAAAYDQSAKRPVRIRNSETVSWNDIFRSLGPLMYQEASESKLVDRLSRLLGERMPEKQGRYTVTHRPTLVSDEFQSVKVHLLALRLIQKSPRKHTVRDPESYWTLTEHGAAYLLELGAITRDDENSAGDGATKATMFGQLPKT